MAKKLSTQEKARRMWVRALRSGKYKWGKQALQPKDGKFCCLGVLCELAIKQNIIFEYNHNHGNIPDNVKIWVGLMSNTGVFYDGYSLAEMNDQSKRNPFKKIANLIEKKPDGLFVEEEF